MKKLFFTALLILVVNIVYSQSHVISMTTSIAKGNNFAVILSASMDSTDIQIDWGDNTRITYTIGNSPHEIAGLLQGNTIKIYGSDIVYLDVISKSLTNLDVSGATMLTDLYCASNLLSSLDVSKSKDLVNLNCSSNFLTSLEVKKNKGLRYLYCSSNQLNALDLTKNTELILLHCSSNQIEQLDVSNNTMLTTLYCSSNLLNSVDLSKNTALAGLYCFSNSLDTLDVTNNTSLTNLWCFSNELSAIDISQNLLLTNLNCSSNKLRDLDVSNNTALTSLSCSSNQLNFATLPIKKSKWNTYQYSPQQTFKPSALQYTEGEKIDLSHFTSSMFPTVYTWKRENGTTLEAGTDYMEENGVFTFLKAQSDAIYCHMANSTFPDLMLKTEKINISTPTNIEAISRTISIYPNPFVDLINIESSEIIHRLELYTASGKRLSEKTIGNTACSLPLNFLSGGIYFLKIYSKEKISLHKIIRK